ncbi:4Fe-4S dicluster domain-containing protein [Bacteroidota bacterium]
MNRQIVFAITLLLTLGVFGYTVRRLVAFFKLTKPAFPVRNFGKRLTVMLEVAFGQTKIFRHPVMGLLHALVFWGFCVILIGSVEMVVDGLFGLDRSLKELGLFYDIIMASGDVFALLIAIAIIIFLTRRIFIHIKRFEGVEMKKASHIDANIALTMILLLMISLLGMNITYVGYQNSISENIAGVFPVSSILAGFLITGNDSHTLHMVHEVFWWAHIVLIFIFANMLPYSKHFHVFMSVPNVFLSRLDPLGKLPNMENVTKEVKLMMDPNTAFAAAPADEPVVRFGVKDIEDVSWKNYFDSLACTQCGRCTAVCPANITGKLLSPRKVIMNVRARMNEKGPGLVKNPEFNDNKSLLRDWVTEEELWACTTCNACAQECPININHPTLIVDMRRYLVMEEGSAPGELKTVFNNIENNGAPWQYSPEDRLLWAENLEMKVH